ncbi:MULTISPECIES: FtsB family cell division protein [Myroides]|uniref:Septum formation initiator family protein n=1 Tax=Myroides albus TaxID=2562892 RepID=A0A6I3LMK7_9FLAO|nr:MULTISPECIES: septum formation initiator family protein [Myroides]MTG98947.1 septum formation initiator family protein [Myroides albus]MVX35517.1 septum formation initiator family protein [Myroides sp. LoEW2-1]UVD78585.1 septum formation initiator family protein [Myroides albus]
MNVSQIFSNFKYSKILKNVFFWITISFAVWIIFFDSFSYFEHRTIDKEIEKLEDNRRYFQKEIDKDKKAIKGLKNGDATEKYAREKYYMKRANEDIFIIEFDTLAQ